MLSQKNNHKKCVIRVKFSIIKQSELRTFLNVSSTLKKPEIRVIAFQNFTRASKTLRTIKEY